MYYLVKFVVYHVCEQKDIRIQGKSISAKWGNSFYEVDILFVSSELTLVKELHSNMIYSLPQVVLEKLSSGISTSTPVPHSLENYTSDCENDEPTYSSYGISESDIDPFETDDDSSYYPSSDELNNNCDTPTRNIENVGINRYIKQRKIAFDTESENFEEKNMQMNYFDESIQSHNGTSEMEAFPAAPKCKSTNPARKSKVHSCLYCGGKQAKLTRHLERKHFEEELVKIALKFKKGSQERIKAFERIRKEGDFKKNIADPENLISVGGSSKPSHTKLLPCPFCKGFYSKKNLRNHVRLNCNKKELSRRKIIHSSKSLLLENMPLEACDRLRNEIFPSMRDDNIFQIVLKDSTIIKYGNMLLLKYSTSSHHNKMITQQLRHIGKIFSTVNELNSSIGNVEEMINPKHYDDIVRAIHILAGLVNGKYKYPSVANHSCTLLMHLVHFIKCESIKSNDVNRRKVAEDFAYLMEHSQNALITKIASENRTQQQRSKIEILPSSKEITELNELLEKHIEEHMSILEEHFNYTSWCLLNKLVLVQVLVFNRKRPGDVEKTRLVEYNSITFIESDEQQKLGSEGLFQASTFGRFISRGKLNRPAPTLISKKNIAVIKVLLKYRNEAGVDPENEFLFANPKGKKNKYFKADDALKNFCKENGLNESKLTATKLRKHLATVTSTLPQDKQQQISDFMGQGMEIHNNIYRQRQAFSDIITMGRVLTEALGNNHNNISGFHRNEPENTIQIDASPATQMDYSEQLSVIEEPSCETALEDIMSTSAQMSEALGNNHNNISGFHGNEPENTVQMGASHTTQMEYSEQLSVIEEEPSCETVSEDILSRGAQNCTPKIRTRVVQHSVLQKSKRTWRTPERKLVKDKFNQYIENNKVPSLHECQELIYENDGILSRSPNQVRSWIIAEIKRRKNGENGKKNRWSTPAKEKCRKHFRKYYKNGTYPPQAELLEAIKTIPELADKNSRTLLSHLQHDYKYLSH